MKYVNRNNIKMAMVLPGVPDIPSKAVFQRPISMSRQFDVELFCALDVCQKVRESVTKAHICPVKNDKLNRIVFPIWAIAKIISKKMNRGVDLVMVTHPNWSLIVGVVSNLLGIKWVADLIDDPSLWFTVHRDGKGLIPRLGKLYQWLLLKAVKTRLRRAILVICVGKGSQELYVNRYKIEKQKSMEITNGVFLELFQKQKPLSFEGRTPVVLYVGHVKKIYVSILVEAIKRLHCQGVHFDLRLVGPVQPDAERWIRSELNGSVHMTGNIPHNEVLQEIERSHVCIYPFPSSPETDYVSPIKIFEYQAMGRPVVASDLPGVRGLVQDGVNGFLVSSHDTTAFAGAIAKLVKNPELAASMGDRGRETVKQFDWNIINDEIIFNIENSFASYV